MRENLMRKILLLLQASGRKSQHRGSNMQGCDFTTNININYHHCGNVNMYTYHGFPVFEGRGREEKESEEKEPVERRLVERRSRRAKG